MASVGIRVVVPSSPSSPPESVVTASVWQSVLRASYHVQFVADRFECAKDVADPGVMSAALGGDRDRGVSMARAK